MTAHEAAKITAALASLYDVPAWTAERLDLFAAAIEDLDYAAAMRAAQVWMATRSERPQPADIRESTRVELEAAGQIPSLLPADEAWALVLREMRERGQYRGFGRGQDYPAVDAALAAMGGFRALCMSDNPEADRAHFLRLYTAIATRERTRTLAQPALAAPTGSVAVTGRRIRALVGGGD